VARLLDTRRLTGRNLLLPGPGAAAEVAVAPGDDGEALEARLRSAITATLQALSLPADPLVVRRSSQGLSLAVAAPADALLTAADALELAIHRVLGTGPGVADVDGADDGVIGADPVVTRQQEQNPALVALIDESRRRQLPFVVDDEGLTLGLGVCGVTYPLDALPAPSSVPWSQLGAIPVALVTGTNGKTTTTRMLASILAHTGRVVGTTSTDGVVVDGVVVERGDWSGPGGARRVLRDARVEVAALEAARGGLLRRGLPLDGYDVGVVTNVADDHLGEFGVDTLDDMADVKCLVARGVRAGGVVVLNGADALLRARAAALPGRVVFFAVDRADVADDLAAGGEAWWVDVVDGRATIMRGAGAMHVALVAVDEVPACFGGAARYNVDNALAAAAAARALGADDGAIAAGLRAFSTTASSNPGRGNVLRHGGVTIVIDFAHNPAAVAALGGLVRHLRGDGGGLRVCLGAPGDRLDSELSGLADAIADLGPDHVVLRELEHYRRGRAPGAVPALLRARLRARGVVVDDDTAADDLDGLARVLAGAGAGDVVVLTPIVDADEVFAAVRAKGFTDG
jgi:cyanophycin synthetase